MKRRTSGVEIAQMLKISPAKGIEAVMKAQIIAAVIKVVEREKITHVEIALRSKLPRTAVTGILSGSLQKVTIDRLLRLADAVGLTAQLVIKKSA